MKLLLFYSSIVLLMLTSNIFAQINITDSTVQVIGYWNIGEKQSFSISEEKYQVKDSDTTSREFTSYTVDISVIDSTENSYTINWYYHDIQIQTDSEILNKLSTLLDSINIKILTDEYGAFVKIINWQEVREFILKGTSLLKDELKDIPNMNKIISQIEKMYSTEESISNAAINEIHQFYSYHGGQYKLGEQINSKIKSPNIYGGEPFDTDVSFSLDEIRYEDNNSVLRMTQSVNAEQLTKVTFDYLAQMANTMEAPSPKWDKFPTLTNNTWVTTQIHGSGWTIYSIETKEVSALDVLRVEERIIEIL
jgi:hypothetical protein